MNDLEMEQMVEKAKKDAYKKNQTVVVKCNYKDKLDIKESAKNQGLAVSCFLLFLYRQWKKNK